MRTRIPLPDPCRRLSVHTWESSVRLQSSVQKLGRLDGARPWQYDRGQSLPTHLMLLKGRLAGIAPALDALRGLRRLYLGSHQLSGPLPDSWAHPGGMLSRLQRLDVSFNRLTGSLPQAWLDCQQGQPPQPATAQSGGLPPSQQAPAAAPWPLKELRLNSNSLAGALPSSWPRCFPEIEARGSGAAARQGGTALWPRLGWPSLSTAAALLQALDLKDNLLHGPLPPEWFEPQSFLQ